MKTTDVSRKGEKFSLKSWNILQWQLWAEGYEELLTFSIEGIFLLLGNDVIYTNLPGILIILESKSTTKYTVQNKIEAFKVVSEQDILPFSDRSRDLARSRPLPLTIVFFYKFGVNPTSKIKPSPLPHRPPYGSPITIRLSIFFSGFPPTDPGSSFASRQPQHSRTAHLRLRSAWLPPPCPTTSVSQQLILLRHTIGSSSTHESPPILSPKSKSSRPLLGPPLTLCGEEIGRRMKGEGEDRTPHLWFVLLFFFSFLFIGLALFI